MSSKRPMPSHALDADNNSDRGEGARPRRQWPAVVAQHSRRESRLAAELLHNRILVRGGSRESKGYPGVLGELQIST